jgi:hypothetical protein
MAPTSPARLRAFVLRLAKRSATNWHWAGIATITKSLARLRAAERLFCALEGCQLISGFHCQKVAMQAHIMQVMGQQALIAKCGQPTRVSCASISSRTFLNKVSGGDIVSIAYTLTAERGLSKGDEVVVNDIRYIVNHPVSIGPEFTRYSVRMNEACLEAKRGVAF